MGACEPDTQPLGSSGLESAVCSLCFTLCKVFHAVGKVNTKSHPMPALKKVTVVGCEE